MHQAKETASNMGSFDELITPFLMDSSENFDFDEHGGPSGGVTESHGQLSSFDVNMVEDLGLFTQGGHHAETSEHSLGQLGLSTTQLGSLADLSSFQSRTALGADSLAAIPQELLASGPVAAAEDDEPRRVSKRTRKSKRKPSSSPPKAGAPPPPKSEQLESAERRKQMYVDFLKRHVGTDDQTKKPSGGRRKKQKTDEREASVSPPRRTRAKVNEDEDDDASLRRAIALQFLEYRTTNVLDRRRWRDIVDDGFELVLPREPYRVAYGTPAARNSHLLTGVDSLIRDTCSMTALVEMIRARCWKLKQLDALAAFAARAKTYAAARHQTQPQNGSAPSPAPSPPSTVTSTTPPPQDSAASSTAAGKRVVDGDDRRQAARADAVAKITVRYVADANEMLVSDRLLMCPWTFETVGLVDAGFSAEVAVDGMLKATYTEGPRKLEHVVLAFDCMAFMQQLNSLGLLDMAAIAAAAANASRTASNSQSSGAHPTNNHNTPASPTAAPPVGPARAPAPALAARPAALQAALLANPTALASLAAASPAFANALATAAQSSNPEAAARARLFLANIQAAQQTAAGRQQRAGGAGAAPRVATADAPTDTDLAATTAGQAPTIAVQSPRQPATNAAAGQYLRALAASSTANNTSTTASPLQGPPPVPNTASTATAGTSSLQPGQQRPQPALQPGQQQQQQSSQPQQQQMIMQCMPMIANYSWHLALLRQQQQKATTPQQQQQIQATIQRTQQQAQQAQQQLQQQLLHRQLTHKNHSHSLASTQHKLTQPTHHQPQQQQLGQPQHQHHLTHSHLTPQLHQQQQPLYPLSQTQAPLPAQHLPMHDTNGFYAPSPQQQHHAHPQGSAGLAVSNASTLLHEGSLPTSGAGSLPTLGPAAHGTTPLPSNPAMEAHMPARPASTAPRPQQMTAPNVGQQQQQQHLTGSSSNATLLAKYMAASANSPQMMQMMSAYMANALSQRQQQAKQAAGAGTPPAPSNQQQQQQQHPQQSTPPPS